jgi:hypothetical protein
MAVTGWTAPEVEKTVASNAVTAKWSNMTAEEQRAGERTMTENQGQAAQAQVMTMGARIAGRCTGSIRMLAQFRRWAP